MCIKTKKLQSNSEYEELKKEEVKWSIRKHKTAIVVSLVTVGAPMLTLLVQHWPW